MNAQPWIARSRLALAVLLAAMAVTLAAPAIESAHAQGAPTASAAAKVLKKGDRGPGVRKLQRALGIPADGIFGKGTKRAVRRYQRRHGLVADGVAGPQTLGALKVGSGSSRKASGRGRKGGGKSGGGVRELQRALGVPADGAFGPQTESAVKRFQRRRGLAADGVVGPQTRSALGIGPGETLKRKRGGGRSRGGGGGVVQRMVRAANKIARKPYVYGGGHGDWTDSGYDCSGSISYVLHRAGLLRTALDSTGFMSYGRPGRGRRVTIYANAGHAYMVIDGRRFDTSARSETGSRWTRTPRSSAGYVARHPPGL